MIVPQSSSSSPIKMGQKIIVQVDDEFSLFDEEGSSVDTNLAKKIDNVFFESPGDNIKLQMNKCKHLANFLSLKPKINPEIESSKQYQIKTSFAKNNEKIFTQVKVIRSKLFQYYQI